MGPASLPAVPIAWGRYHSLLCHSTSSSHKQRTELHRFCGDRRGAERHPKSARFDAIKESLCRYIGCEGNLADTRTVWAGRGINGHAKNVIRIGIETSLPDVRPDPGPADSG